MNIAVLDDGPIDCPPMFYNLRISRLCVMSLAQFHQPSRYSEMRRLQAETSPGGRVGEPFEGTLQGPNRHNDLNF